MGTLLKGLQRVQWGDLGAARGATAGDIPALLSKAAWSDEGTASMAVDELADLICELGFVVQEATAPTVPFLVELAGATHMACKADVLALLLKVFNGRQWSAAAEAAPPKYDSNYTEQVGWEAASKQAERAGQPIFRELARSTDPQFAEAAAELLQAIAAAATQ
ncbi:hypothetical protein ACFV2U_41315 [Streptomyces sp. NPDC059697]|uniref:hypothetical protein n=1 Tax=Streptomyces sp. NPDC059697 TaxID=3346912 RepID=UPI0036CBB1D0